MANISPHEQPSNTSPFKNVGTPECSLNRDIFTPKQLEILENPSVLVANAVYILTKRLQDPYLARSTKRLPYYSDQLTQLLNSYSDEDGLRDISFKGRNSGKGIAAESVFYTLISDSLGEENIKISDGMLDKEGVDFIVMINDIEHRVDVSASVFDSGMLQKVGDPTHSAVFIPVEPGRAIQNIPSEIGYGIKKLSFQEDLNLEKVWFTDSKNIKPRKATEIDREFIRELITMHTKQGGIYHYISDGLHSPVSLEQSYGFMRDLKAAIS